MHLWSLNSLALESLVLFLNIPIHRLLWVNIHRTFDLYVPYLFSLCIYDLLYRLFMIYMYFIYSHCTFVIWYTDFLWSICTLFILTVHLRFDIQTFYDLFVLYLFSLCICDLIDCFVCWCSLCTLVIRINRWRYRSVYYIYSINLSLFLYLEYEGLSLLVMVWSRLSAEVFG